MKRTYQEITKDNGIERTVYASNNNAEYIITSAYAHDLYEDYEDKYNRHPTVAWLNRHFRFERIK